MPVQRKIRLRELNPEEKIKERSSLSKKEIQYNTMASYKESRIQWLRDRGVQIEIPNENKKTKKQLETYDCKVVKIPCNDDNPIEELTLKLDRSHNGDQLVEYLRIYFKSKSGELDKNLLQETASKQFGNMDINISPSALDSIGAMGSTEVFPLTHPSIENDFRGVSFYLDEAGQLKRLPRNNRAIAIANLCGFENVPLVGDMFIARRKGNLS
jgi:hypothetical protein